MLKLGAIAGGETDLAQGIVETALLGDLRQPDIVVDVPARTLLNIADHQAAGNIRHTIGELKRLGTANGPGHSLDPVERNSALPRAAWSCHGRQRGSSRSAGSRSWR